MNISAIYAVSRNGVIGNNNELPWYLPDDMKYFKKITTGHHVVMGRKNWESIPEKYRPLPDRTNWVLTRNVEKFMKANQPVPNTFVMDDLNQVLNNIANNEPDAEIFIIGGAEIYKLAMPLVTRLYVTEIDADIDGDVYLPKWSMGLWVTINAIHHPADEKHEYPFTFKIYGRISD